MKEIKTLDLKKQQLQCSIHYELAGKSEAENMRSENLIKSFVTLYHIHSELISWNKG